MANRLTQAASLALAPSCPPGARPATPLHQETVNQGTAVSSHTSAVISRRSFLAATGVAAGTILAGIPGAYPAEAGAATALPAGQPKPRWFEHAWRRAVIDMHIPDWDPKFLSEFNADRYVAALVQSRAQSIVCYAQSHVGLFNYPTKVGRQHAGLNGRDIVAEMIERCHQRGIAVVLYVSVIHDRWASDQHPDWRISIPTGVTSAEAAGTGSSARTRPTANMSGPGPASWPSATTARASAST